VSDFLEWLFDDCLICGFVAMIAVLLGGVFAFAVIVDKLDCGGFERATGIETRWEWACYAKVDGKWIPKKFVFGDANELRIKSKP